MFVFSLTLLSLPIDNPFPDSFRLSMGIIAVFSVLLIIAKQKKSSPKWLHTFYLLLIICGAILAGVSGYYSLSGPSTVDPFIPKTNLHNSYFPLYVFVGPANIFLLLFLFFIACISLFFLFRQSKRK